MGNFKALFVNYVIMTFAYKNYNKNVFMVGRKMKFVWQI
jgi:hypothetical protein